MRRWQLQEAKNRLSHVVREARERGPQYITLHGRDAAVVLSAADYDALVQPSSSLLEFFRSSPLVGEDLDIDRVDEPAPVIEL